MRKSEIWSWKSFAKSMRLPMFASVYREFKEVDEFVKQVMQLDSRSQTPRKE